MSIQDLIARKKKDIDSKKANNIKTHKPPAGKNIYRILPAWREQTEAEKEDDLSAPFWHDFSLHWIKSDLDKNKPDAVYICTDKTFGKPCDICETLESAIVQLEDSPHKDLLKGQRSRQTYLLNALHVNGQNPTEPVILEVGTIIFEQICEHIAEYGDITDLQNGQDIIIKREGSGFETKYTVLPAAKSNPVSPSVMEKVHNLDTVVAQENATKAKAALNKLGEITGVIPKALPGSSPKSQLAHDAVIEDAEFEDLPDDWGAEQAETTEVVEATDAADDDFDIDNELDALLAAEG